MLNERTKQVQFRMPDELHARLKAALAYDRSSFTAFFNHAAEAYLQERMPDTERTRRDKGERRDG